MKVTQLPVRERLAHSQWKIFSAHYCRTAFDRGKEPSCKRIAPVLSGLVAGLGKPFFVIPVFVALTKPPHQQKNQNDMVYLRQ